MTIIIIYNTLNQLRRAAAVATVAISPNPSQYNVNIIIEFTDSQGARRVKSRNDYFSKTMPRRERERRVCDALDGKKTYGCLIVCLYIRHLRSTGVDGGKKNTRLVYEVSRDAALGLGEKIA